MDFALNFDKNRIFLLENLFLNNKIENDFVQNEKMDFSIIKYLEPNTLIDEEINNYKENPSQLLIILNKIKTEK